MLALLFAISTVFGVLFSIAILRADRTSWDNRVFAGMALIDAFSNAYRVVRLLGGHALVDLETTLACTLAALPMGVASVEFAYSFPFNRPAPSRLRVPVVLGMLVMAGLELSPGFAEAHPILPTCYSAPLLVLAVVFLARNLKATTGDKTAVVLVGAALTMRWLSGIVTYGVVRLVWPGQFPSAVFVDATLFALVSYMLIVFAFMRSQLFSLRGLAAELLTLFAGGMGVIALSVLAVEGALHSATSPGALRVALVLVTFLPLGAVAVGARLGRVFERAVGQSIDPRRSLREKLLERALASRDPDPLVFVHLVEAALAELSGGRAIYLAAEGSLLGRDRMPRGLAERLATIEQGRIVRGRDPDVPYDLVIAVRSATSVHGAVAIDGGLVDRNTVLGATTLADRLALRLDAYALFIELEAARRLATLGAFAAAIAHDIRTPLTSVQMNVQILQRKVSLPPDDMEYFDIALEELKRLNSSITELLDFAKPAQVESSPLDLSRVIADARRAIDSVVAERGVSLDVEVNGDTPLALGDTARLRNVLENLVTNAANASREGGRITIRTRRADDGRAVLEVADEGRGIAPADLPRIFEPFFTTRPDGTGLGLAICDKLVRALQGEIRVQAALGEGATFAVHLPAADVTIRHEALPAE